MGPGASRVHVAAEEEERRFINRGRRRQEPESRRSLSVFMETYAGSERLEPGGRLAPRGRLAPGGEADIPLEVSIQAGGGPGLGSPRVS